MTTQSYLRPEMADLEFDQEGKERWAAMVDRLGLKGQRKGENIEAKPIPFVAMNRTLQNAIATLCPSECSVEDYGFDAIPLEALELIQIAKDCGRFSKIVVAWRAVNSSWNTIGNYETEADAKAAKGVYNVSFQESGRFLIARWGAEFRALSQLIQDAKERFIREKTNEAKKQIADWSQKLATVDLEATEVFG